MGAKISKDDDGDNTNSHPTRESKSYDYESDATSQVSGLYNCADFTLAGQDMFRIDSRVDSEIESISMYSVESTDDEGSTLMSHSMKHVRSILGFSKSFDESYATQDEFGRKSVGETGTVKTIDSDGEENMKQRRRANANLIAFGIVIFIVLLAIILGGSLSGSNSDAISSSEAIHTGLAPNPLPPTKITSSPTADVGTTSTAWPITRRTPSPTRSPTPKVVTANPTTANPADARTEDEAIQERPVLNGPASIIVYDMLKEYMNDDSRVVDPTTPQGKAFQDLVSAEELWPMRQSYRVMQRYVLMTLYYSTSPDSWDSTFGWDDITVQNECTFYGVATCRRSFRGVEVLKLDLSDSGLIGTIPDEICLLEYTLEHLYLNSNSITGNLPSCLSDFQNLQTIDMHNNLLSGTLPRGLMFSPSLKYVDLSNNGLEGGLDILFEGGGVTKPIALDLETFNVANNKLSGTIPEGFAALVNLSELPEL
eukprot:CAMPEP_0194235982 /NCGR_PEP_ID=MMETSP0158-20130606/3338_1 /TAXON_ID=33649 /ORGANISM="Thalassionema nitzschioides, Strain L26-B" /LENGTH=481 /DNA_ID=CAMNT_0038969607 /DNA_START=22 /DNA_END=1467 /DNA_ORIENTATION=-